MPQFNQGLFNGQLFGPGVPTVTTTAAGILYIAFREARVLLRPQALNSGNELADGMIFLNQQLNYWAARDCYAYTTNFQLWNLTAGHQPHLIGPGLPPPDFDVPTRPVNIVSAAIVLPGQSPVDLPLNIRDNAWWANQQVKDITSSIPTDLYYEPDYPNGSLYFWPIPNGGNGVRLQTTVFLQQFQALDDAFIAPQAYQAAVALTLAEELSDIWGTTPPPNLARRALKARDAVQSNNNLAPRIASADWGTFTSPAGDFNYMTGLPPNS
jgi:hypothetical protein